MLAVRTSPVSRSIGMTSSLLMSASKKWSKLVNSIHYDQLCLLLHKAYSHDSYCHHPLFKGYRHFFFVQRANSIPLLHPVILVCPMHHKHASLQMWRSFYISPNQGQQVMRLVMTACLS